MATEPHNRPSIRAERAKRADGGEPLNDEQRSVMSYGNSLVIGLTDYGVRTHDVDVGQTPSVLVYPDGIWIDFGGENE